MEYFGSKDILKHHKTGFLSSRKCPAEVVLKSYEWAKKQRAEGNCVVCGNHSQIEKDVFDILLKGEQPLILVLAREMKKHWTPDIKEAIEEKRLLVICPFEKVVKRVSRESAETRNKYIVEISDRIQVGYKTKEGQLDRILNNIPHAEL